MLLMAGRAPTTATRGVSIGRYFGGFFLPILAGCSSGLVVGGSAAPDEETAATENVIEDVGDAPRDSDAADTDTDYGTFPLDDEGCPSYYAQDVLPEIALTFEPNELAALEVDRRNYQQNYHPAVFTYEGETWEVMVRLRGNTWTPKYELSISFNEIDPDGRFHGLRKVSLDGASYETTMLRNRVAAWWFRQFGLPAYCVNNVKLTMNGAYFGLYSNTEDIDHEFIERNFPDDASGTNYKDGSTAKSNAENSVAEHVTTWATASDPNALAAVLDIDEVMLAWAAEAALPNTDGFVYGLHNYYLYDHPERGFVYIPSDLDFSFDGSQALDVQPYTVDPLTYARVGNGAQFVVFRNDPTWRARYVRDIATVVGTMDADTLNAKWREWDSQIHEALEADPNRAFTMSAHDQHVTDVQTFVERRVSFMREWVAAHPG